MLAKSFRLSAVFLLVVAIVPALAQNSSNELSAYTSAVARVHPSDRLAQLEHFAIDSSPGPLKIQALEFVIWEHLRTRNTGHAITWADELSNIDKNNPIALAVLSNRARSAVEQGAMKPGQLLRMASRGLDNIPQLQRPLGMSVADFGLLRQQAYAMLSGAAGAAELGMKDYVAARAYLHNSVSVDPNNPRYVYPLALADLNGPDKNTKEGYWSLARAVNLTRGTSEGSEIAHYARDRYVRDGGTTTAWNQFLVSAASTRQPTASSSTLTASAAPPPAVSRPVPRVTPPATNASIKTPTVATPRKSQPAPSVWADDTSPPAIRKRRI